MTKQKTRHSEKSQRDLFRISIHELKLVLLV